LTHIVKCRQWLDRWIVPDKLFMARPMNRITRGDLLELRGRVRARVKVDSKRIRGDGMNTVNKAMSAVFTVFAEAAFRQHIPANPAADIGNVLYDLEEREVLSLEELEQLFAKPWESRLAFDVFRFAELTGMRCSEILSIVPSAQLRGDVLQVDTAFKGKERGKPKWGKTRTIVLCAAALEILSRRPGGFRYEDGRRLGETWWRDGRIELHYKCLRGRIVSLFALEM
jgi:integrase